MSSAAVYVMVAGALLTRSIAAGAAIGLTFGLVRGVSILLPRHVWTPDDLRRFHRRVAANATRSVRVGVATQGLIGAAGFVALLGAR